MNKGTTQTHSIMLEYSEDGPGSYSIMAVRMCNVPYDRMSGGYTEGQNIFMLLGGGVQICTHDIYKFDRKVTAKDDENLIKILSMLDDAELWEFREYDGHTFTAPVDF